jgi:hypothetical protein
VQTLFFPSYFSFSRPHLPASLPQQPNVAAHDKLPVSAASASA